MSFQIKSLAGEDLDANMVIGGAYDLAEPTVIRIRIGNEESVISVQHFCDLAERYLQGGIFGPMPECAKETVKRLVQFL